MLKSLKIGVSALALAMMTMTASAQEDHRNPNVRSAQKAFTNGDFKSAIHHLEKALPAEAKDPNVLYLLGYSQFQTGEYAKAADTFGKVIALDAKNANAYYFKAKANTTVVSSTKVTDQKRISLLESAITDLSSAIAIDAKDVKLYQNRGLAYRDLAIAVGTEGQANYNKANATSAYNKAIADYEKVLSIDANRKDIQTELKKAKTYRDLLK